MSVTVAFFVPFWMTLAPTMGSPSWSVMRPLACTLRLSCALTAIAPCTSGSRFAVGVDGNVPVGLSAVEVAAAKLRFPSNATATVKSFVCLFIAKVC